MLVRPNPTLTFALRPLCIGVISRTKWAVNHEALLLPVPGRRWHGRARAPHGIQEEMTLARVRAFLEQRLAHHGKPRLKIGEIITVDGSLVQKLASNRYPGRFRQLQRLAGAPWP